MMTKNQDLVSYFLHSREQSMQLMIQNANKPIWRTSLTILLDLYFILYSIWVLE